MIIRLEVCSVLEKRHSWHLQALQYVKKMFDILR